MQFYKLAVLQLHKLTTDAICISFNIPENLKSIFAFTQGQYITLKTIINNNEVRRSYSICSTVQSGQLQIGVKKVQDGLFSTYANETLKVGDILEVAPPNGKFYSQLLIDNKKNYLGIVAGSGITPLMSIIGTTLATEPNSHFTLIYSNKNRQSIMFSETLEALKNNYVNRLQIIHILSQEIMDMPMFTGRIDAEKCNAIGQKLVDFNSMDEAFLCGPEDMVITLKNFLATQNMPAQNIHAELFGTLKTQKEKTHKVNETALGKICNLTIIKDGNTMQIKLPFETDNVLDAALKTNADMPFACKGGVCCTCKARLTQGQIYMDVNYGLEPDEIAAGFILTCQAFPITETVTVNFDDV